MSNADKYVFKCISEYPTLYGSTSFKTSKLKVLDHIFNVIGNGYADHNLHEILDVSNLDISKKYIAKYLKCSGVWYGYKESNIKRINISGEEWVYHSGEPEEFYLTNADDKVNYPEIADWIFSKYNSFCPYPNFQKEYSMVYDCKTFWNLDKSWFYAALCYYKECKKWFIKHEFEYSSSFPCKQKSSTERRVKDMQQYLSQKKYKNNSEISKAYNCEFTGSIDNYQDVFNFLVKLWEKEKNRINIFIDETIKLLSTKE
jgi:hypothetical protein